MTHTDFYITAATVIPVLLLANTVQGRFYRAYIDFCVRHTGPRFRPVSQGLITVVAVYTAAAAGFGEYGAFNVLNGGADTLGNRRGVTAALVSLLVITSLALALEILGVIWAKPKSENDATEPRRR